MSLKNRLALHLPGLLAKAAEAIDAIKQWQENATSPIDICERKVAEM